MVSGTDFLSGGPLEGSFLSCWLISELCVTAHSLRSVGFASVFRGFRGGCYGVWGSLFVISPKGVINGVAWVKDWVVWCEVGESACYSFSVDDLNDNCVLCVWV